MLLGDGCLHGVSQFHLRMVKCTESPMVLGSLNEDRACCSFLSCWKARQAQLFAKVHVHHARPLCMLCSFFHW